MSFYLTKQNKTASSCEWIRINLYACEIYLKENMCITNCIDFPMELLVSQEIANNHG